MTTTRISFLTAIVLSTASLLSADVVVRVGQRQQISNNIGGLGAVLAPQDDFGESMDDVPDLNGDGIVDLIVGAEDDDDGGTNRGAVYILFLDTDGTVQSHAKISDTAGGFSGVLNNVDRFGQHVAWLGSLDGSGPPWVAVSAVGDDDGGADIGAVWLLALNTNGTVQTHTKISATSGGFGASLASNDHFGHSLERLGDLDGDGVVDLAVASEGDDDGGVDTGAVYILFLNPNGTVKSHVKISDVSGGFTGTLDAGDQFGQSIGRLGDLDGDGITELAVGAEGDDDGATGAGAVWILFLNANGTVKSHVKISSTAGGFTGDLDSNDQFGQSIAVLDDVDGDGMTDLAVGAEGDDDGATDSGALWILLLNPDGTVRCHSKISATTGNLGAAPGVNGNLGNATAHLGDLNGDGITDVVTSADGSDADRGVLHVLFLEIDDCDDGIACTADSGGPTGGCVYTPVHATCNDGNVCTMDSCDRNLGCVNDGTGITTSCNDGDSATVNDACQGDAAGTCSGDAPPAGCDDGLFCNGVEAEVNGVCQPGSEPCDDGVMCTTDTCNESNDTCGHALQHAVCDNGLFCDGAEVCHALLGCRSGTPPACDDGVACTTDACSEAAAACTHTPSDATCDNGAWCDGAELCDSAFGCLPGAAPCSSPSACDEDAALCTCASDDDCAGMDTSCRVGTCDLETALCIVTLLDDDTLCDDGDPCTDLDTCTAGTCGGMARPDCCGTADDCATGDPCTQSVCIDATCQTLVESMTDTDEDGEPDCSDGCPNDPNKIAAGQCGCGQVEGTCFTGGGGGGGGSGGGGDGCPSDPFKVAPGVCGCGAPDIDTDGDGALDCLDGCPDDPDKIDPQRCGCGASERDRDDDGTPDCDDACRTDPDKTAAGACGCGTPDTDSDDDGTPDCADECPDDPDKATPGACGCGATDGDMDEDGAADCSDECPNDPAKTAVGMCGCGASDDDSDGDGVADCNDGCPADPDKGDAGACGCGLPDTDFNGDGVTDCIAAAQAAPQAAPCGLAGLGLPFMLMAVGWGLRRTRARARSSQAMN